MQLLCSRQGRLRADRESGDATAKIWPDIVTAARAHRDFLRRAVTYCVTEAGIRQFIDIGTGLPSADKTHEVAQLLVPESRIVYINHDPLMLTDARAQLTAPEGATEYIDADLRRPSDILKHPALRATVDLNKPVALMLVAVLHLVPDIDDPYGFVHTLMDASPAGSHLVLSHASTAMIPQSAAEQFATGTGPGRGDFYDRDPGQIGRFFDGLDLVEPGLEIVSRWPEPATVPPTPEQVSIFGGIAAKPASTAQGGSVRHMSSNAGKASTMTSHGSASTTSTPIAGIGLTPGQQVTGTAFYGYDRVPPAETRSRLVPPTSGRHDHDS